MQFNIQQGKHYSNGYLFRFGFTLKNEVSFDASFSRTCLYKPFPKPDSHDINKLCGFATTLLHHKQSGRIGWRCVDESGEIELVTYSYNMWKRDISDQNVLGRVKPCDWFTVKIEDKETHYLYSLTYNGKTVTNKDKKQPDWMPIKFLLFPYFGGNNPAPHDMKIFLNRT
jgi:hypothetical protein